MNRKQAKREIEHILLNQKTVSTDRLRAIWKGLNFDTLEGENRSLRKKINRLRKSNGSREE